MPDIAVQQSVLVACSATSCKVYERAGTGTGTDTGTGTGARAGAGTATGTTGVGTGTDLGVGTGASAGTSETQDTGHKTTAEPWHRTYKRRRTWSISKIDAVASIHVDR